MSGTGSILIQVADAVRQELDDFTFRESVTPRRSYDTEMQLQDDGILHVDCVPVLPKSELETRGEITYSCPVDIGIRKKFGTIDAATSGEIPTETIDRLILLVEEIHEFFAGRRLVAYTEATWASVDIRAPWIPKHLREWRQFTGLVRVVYDVKKAL